MRSGKIRVLKRDGSGELFDKQKLAGTLFRAMKTSGADIRDSIELAGAVEIYLERKGTTVISSAAVFEMGLKVLRRVNYSPAAHLMERYRSWRADKRKTIRIVHETGNETVWEKSWAAKLACSHFNLQPQTARILAGIVESKIIRKNQQVLDRLEIITLLTNAADAFGLAEQPIGI